MRYAIFSALYPPHLGGVELYTRNLARHLVARGDEVTVVTSALEPGDEGREVDEAGVAVLRLPAIMAMDGRLPLIRPFSPWRRELDEVAGAGVDRVVVNTRFYPLSLAGIEFGGSRGLPTLVIDHGQGFLTLDNPAIDWVIERYERAIKRWSDRWHPLYAGVSAASARWLATIGVRTDLVVPNAIDADAFRAEATDFDVRKALGLDAGTPVALFAARLTPEKGPRIFCQAARFLPKVAFVMVGSGPLEAECAAFDAPNFHFLGRISHGDLSATMARADAFCVPSLQEGLLTTLLEASAQGLPPVTTPIGGSDEVLGDSSWGVVLERRTPLALAMGVEQVLDWPSDLREERSRALAEHVRTRCTWEGTLEALDRAFA